MILFLEGNNVITVGGILRHTRYSNQHLIPLLRTLGRIGKLVVSHAPDTVFNPHFDNKAKHPVGENPPGPLVGPLVASCTDKAVSAYHRSSGTIKCAAAGQYRFVIPTQPWLPSPADSGAIAPTLLRPSQTRMRCSVKRSDA